MLLITETNAQKAMLALVAMVLVDGACLHCGCKLYGMYICVECQKPQIIMFAAPNKIGSVIISGDQWLLRISKDGAYDIIDGPLPWFLANML